VDGHLSARVLRARPHRGAHHWSASTAGAP
jgi:hypothetical protein